MNYKNGMEYHILHGERSSSTNTYTEETMYKKKKKRKKATKNIKHTGIQSQEQTTRSTSKKEKEKKQKPTNNEKEKIEVKKIMSTHTQVIENEKETIESIAKEIQYQNLVTGYYKYLENNLKILETEKNRINRTSEHSKVR